MAVAFSSRAPAFRVYGAISLTRLAPRMLNLVGQVYHPMAIAVSSEPRGWPYVGLIARHADNAKCRGLRVGFERFRPSRPSDCHAAAFEQQSQATRVETSATCSGVLRAILQDVDQEKKKWSPLDRMTRSESC